ncbi:hypothetical protein GCM10020229_60600 [Kitasatospora albolonga]
MLLDEATGAVLGRFNLVDVADGEAELGYRVAEGAAGRGWPPPACARSANSPPGLRPDRPAGRHHGRQRRLPGRAGPHGVQRHRETTLSGGLPALTFRRSLGREAHRLTDQAP